MREANKLSPIKVARVKMKGRYGDGQGLWLQVSEQGQKAWLFRYMLNGRAREMGLGALHTVSLQEARARARQARQVLLDGFDPIDVKRSYRYEQGFTFELNLSGVADEHHEAFVGKRDTDVSK